MAYCIVIVIGYLLGCSSMALYLSKLNKVDFRSGGSGNLGASNATILMGWKAGVLVGIHDIGKAALAVILAKVLFPDIARIGAVAGVSCVLGHIFPFYLKFKGGKGFAAYYGMTLALNWKLALVVGIAVILVTLITDYIVSGTMTTIISVPAYLGFADKDGLLVLILLIATAVIVYKHRENFKKILNGTELGLRSAIRGDNRVK